jgi:hypothetical protein
MATAKEIAKYCKDKKLFKKAKKSLCAFSNFSIFVDGDLEALEKQAKNDRLEFFLLFGEMPKKTNKESKPEIE